MKLLKKLISKNENNNVKAAKVLISEMRSVTNSAMSSIDTAHMIIDFRTRVSDLTINLTLDNGSRTTISELNEAYNQMVVEFKKHSAA